MMITKKTKSTIQEYWRKNITFPKTRGFTFAYCPGVVCKDGFTMSVQASGVHHCSPKRILKNGKYSSFEIGFPSAKESLIMGWIDDDNADPTQTVYGYVPTEVIDAVIEKHGGLV